MSLDVSRRAQALNSVTAFVNRIFCQIECAFQRFAHEFEGRGRKQRFRIQMERDVVDRFAAPKSFGDRKALVFVPVKLRFAQSFFRLGSGSVQQPINVIPESASNRRLQMVAISGQHFVKCICGGEYNFGNQGRVLFGQLGSENIFEFVREFAKFAKTARGRIAFERVYRASDAAQAFFIGRMLFERKAGIVHGLEDLRSALEKELAEF